MGFFYLHVTNDIAGDGQLQQQVTIKTCLTYIFMKPYSTTSIHLKHVHCTSDEVDVLHKNQHKTKQKYFQMNGTVGFHSTLNGIFRRWTHNMHYESNNGKKNYLRHTTKSQIHLFYCCLASWKFINAITILFTLAFMLGMVGKLILMPLYNLL